MLKNKKVVIGTSIIAVLVFVVIIIIVKNLLYKGPIVYSYEKIVINYSQDISKLQLLAQQIQVMDSKGNITKAEVNFWTGSNRTVIINPPIEGFKRGKMLTLKINSNVKFDINGELSNIKSWTFKVKKDRVLKFEDSNFTLGVRRQISLPKGDIYYGMVYKLKGLSMDNYNIKSIRGVKNFSSLRELNLSGNKINTIDELKYLKHLKVLSLANNDISDISALKELKNLDTLWLTGNKIKDYSATTDYYSNLNSNDFKLN